MPWEERTVYKMREEFVSRAHAKQKSLSALCREYGITRRTGYKWLERSEAGELLEDRSRRPKRIHRITAEMNKFKPSENTGYDEAGVIKLDIHSRDEIQDIYEGVRSMQINIIDYLNDLANMQKDKERAENEARDKEAMIGKISEEAYKDPLTKVGNKAARPADQGGQ